MEELKTELHIQIALQMEGLSDFEQELLLFLALGVSEQNENEITNKELSSALHKSLTGISIGLEQLESKGRILRKYKYNKTVPGKLLRIIKIL